jgi:hypothetical protein
VGAHATNTLGAFMPPEYRDISYYYDNDLHQDIIDYPRMPVQDHRHAVLFVDLMEDAAHYVPPSLMPRTHLLGASGFPHDVRPVPGSTEWLYTDDRGRQMRAPMLEVKGGMGHAAIWHNCLLHGARPLKPGPGAGAHLSLRFVLARGEDAAPCTLDAVNARIDGPLFIERDDNPGPKANAQGFVQMPRTPFLQWAS